MARAPRLPSFPNPVNEVSVRVTSAEVAVLVLLALALWQRWLLVAVALDFVVRAVAGPRYSPLARLAADILTPRLPWPARPTAGPPKRFAATIGSVVLLAAS